MPFLWIAAFKSSDDGDMFAVTKSRFIATLGWHLTLYRETSGKHQPFVPQLSPLRGVRNHAGVPLSSLCRVPRECQEPEPRGIPRDLRGRSAVELRRFFRLT